jgi:hypothetical protein
MLLQVLACMVEAPDLAIRDMQCLSVIQEEIKEMALLQLAKPDAGNAVPSSKASLAAPSVADLRQCSDMFFNMDRSSRVQALQESFAPSSDDSPESYDGWQTFKPSDSTLYRLCPTSLTSKDSFHVAGSLMLPDSREGSVMEAKPPHSQSSFHVAGNRPQLSPQVSANRRRDGSASGPNMLSSVVEREGGAARPPHSPVGLRADSLMLANLREGSVMEAIPPRNKGSLATMRTFNRRCLGEEGAE